jgi:3-oxoacyl-[acyl-carrier-protein] synthase II
VITGIGCIGPMGVGPEALAAAAREGAPLGPVESVPTLRGRGREMRVARVATLDRESFLSPGKLRRMGDLSQIWTIACMMARSDAGFDSPGPAADRHAPERRGTFLGTGLGCLRETWDYLEGVGRDGAAMANPFLFSESVANAPAGQSAVELDARGHNCTFTCGDASAAAAAAVAASSIADGRVTLAYCGGVELLPPPVVRVLAALGAPGFLGEGCVALVLESLESARARGARIYAEVAGRASASDPRCRATEWSTDTIRMAGAMRRAVERSGRSGVGKVFLHACGSPPAEQAEDRAVDSVFPNVQTVRASRVFGSLAAAAGFNLALSALDASGRSSEEAVVVPAWSWGGGLFSIALCGPPD